jgi:acetyl esterase/lipase
VSLRWFGMLLLLVLLGALGLAASMPSRALNLLAALGPGEMRADVAYGPLSRHRLDIHSPGPAVTRPALGYPLVVFFYGGSWNRGERADYRFVGQALAARGMVVLVADYRLYPEVRYPDFLRDCAAALAYGLEQAGALGADPRRVFVMGHSAGAYNAAMLALDARWLAGAASPAPARLAGWIGLAGPYDFAPIMNPEVQPVFHHPQVAADSQPIAFAVQAAVPTFLGAARRDNLVDPVRNTQALAAALGAAGTPVTLRLYNRSDHVSLLGALAWPLRGLAPVLDDVTAFVGTTAPAERAAP